MLVGQQIGPFAIEKELGSGAMGTVYRARYAEDGSRVAIKIISHGLIGNDLALQRFEREAGILKQLKHPNIVRLFGTGKWRGTPFFAMDYIHGESLDRIMTRRDRFSWQEVIVLGRQLCSALQHAHEKGIVHRDLKPSNIMLTKDGTVMLTDFGIAKDIDQTALTGANNTIGTAAYMSPEQCRGEKHLTGKSDLYSLGVVFFELLSGRKPFVTESSVDMFMAHVGDPAPRVRGQPACLDVPQTFDTLVHQLMEKKPDQRPRDAAMVSKALDEVERKELDRLSRGEEVAKSGPTESVEMAPMNATDKESARTIRAGAKKKKLKKKAAAPFYRRGWFVTVGCIAIVSLFAFIAWLLLRPESAPSMLDAVKNAKTPEAKITAAKRFLDTYGKADKFKDETEQVKTIYWGAKVEKREDVLLKRHSKEGLRKIVEEGDDPDAYTKTMNALTSEEDGDVVRARALWKELITDFQTDANEEKALWGWVAAKRLKDLDQVEDNLKKVDAAIRHADENATDPRADDELMGRVLEAVRFRQFADDDRSRERWERLSRELKGKNESRNYYLLAGMKSRELLSAKRLTLEERKKFLQDKLKQAEELYMQSMSKNDVPASKAAKVCREIHDLYGSDESLKEEVGKARMMLENR